MTDKMRSAVDAFIANKTADDANRDKYLVCNLEDPARGLTISLVFITNWNSMEANTYDSIYLQNLGFTITLPCYWLFIPRKLSVPYIEFVINTVYRDNDLSFDSNTGGNNNDGGFNPGQHPGPHPGPGPGPGPGMVPGGNMCGHSCSLV